MLTSGSCHPSVFPLMQYRPEIDGLRALAVVPVLLFHAGFGVVAGGFAGVDVFFVISGFLITSIIHREIRDGSFSVVRFYERRGLLPEPPGTASGYRQYGEVDVWRLDFIRRAKALGFTLAEIGLLMGDAVPGEARTAEEVLAASQAKVAELEAHAREVEATLERLRRLVDLCTDDGLGCTALAIDPAV